MNFIELTSHYNGEKIAFNLKNITAISPYFKTTVEGTFISGSQVVMVSGDYYWLEETYEQVISLIKQYEG